MARRSSIAFLVAAAAAAALLLGMAEPTQILEGRDPSAVALLPSVEATFSHESYRPGETARLVISNGARRVTVQVFRSGAERAVARRIWTMKGVPVTRKRAIGSIIRTWAVLLKVGDWPSGLYFARLQAADGRIGFAPLVVRPRSLGEHRGGNLMFLSANNFFWQVARRGDALERTRRWRDLVRPEAALVGVQ